MGIYEGNQKFYQMDMIPDPKDCSFGRRGRTYDSRKGFLSHLNDVVESRRRRTAPSGFCPDLLCGGFQSKIFSREGFRVSEFRI